MRKNNNKKPVADSQGWDRIIANLEEANKHLQASKSIQMENERRLRNLIERMRESQMDERVIRVNSPCIARKLSKLKICMN